MRVKKYFLATILIFFSFLFAFFIFQLDFFGFLTGKHSINLHYLFYCLVLWYLVSFIVFLLDFSDQKNLVLVFLGGTTAFFFGSVLQKTFQLFPTLLNAFFFYLFLFYLQFFTKQRARLFVKFSPQEIFLPIVRSSFIFFLIILGINSYFQGQNFKYPTSLISPASLYPFVKPIAITLNQQLGSQIQNELKKLANQNRNQQELSKIMLDQSLTQMFANLPLNLNTKNLDFSKIVFLQNNNFDVTPLLVSILPSVAKEINKIIAPYLPFLPFVIYLLILLMLSPILWLFNLIFVGLFMVAVRFLIITNFLQLTVEKVDQEVIIL